MIAFLTSLADMLREVFCYPEAETDFSYAVPVLRAAGRRFKPSNI